MYAWLDEILARWRSQGRRPETTFGAEILSLEPGPLRNLILTELKVTLGHDAALVSRETTACLAAAAAYACGVLTVSGMPILIAILWVGPTFAMLVGMLALLSAALHSILRLDSARLNTVLAVLPQITRPAYVNAILPLLNYQPRDASLWPKSENNRNVEQHLISLLRLIEPANTEHWDGRDWVNYRSLFVRSHGSARLALTALSAAGGIGGDQILSAVRQLAASPEDVAKILRVHGTESQQICASAQAVVRKIEARLADERLAAVLLRPSHVKDTSRDEELVRPVELHERTPSPQLLRTAIEQTSDNSELLRVHNGE